MRNKLYSPLRVHNVFLSPCVVIQFNQFNTNVTPIFSCEWRAPKELFIKGSKQVFVLKISVGLKWFKTFWRNQSHDKQFCFLPKQPNLKKFNIVYGVNAPVLCCLWFTQRRNFIHLFIYLFGGNRGGFSNWICLQGQPRGCFGSSRWGASRGSWSWWCMQVEVTGGSLIISWRRVTRQLLDFSSDGTWCLCLTYSKPSGGAAVFSSSSHHHLPSTNTPPQQDDTIYRTHRCSTSTNAFPYYVGNQYFASLAWHSWLGCIFYQRVILVCLNTLQSPQCVLYILRDGTNSWIQASPGDGLSGVIRG